MRQRLSTIWIIAYRELTTRARSKAFRISSAVRFVLGYSFYSVLYGALGALASRTEDAQVAAAPVRRRTRHLPGVLGEERTTRRRGQAAAHAVRLTGG